MSEFPTPKTIRENVENIVFYEIYDILMMLFALLLRT